MNWKNASLVMFGVTISVVLWACKVRISETKTIADTVTDSRVFCSIIERNDADLSVYSSPKIQFAKDSLNDRIRQFAPTKIGDVSVGGGSGLAYACVVASK